MRLASYDVSEALLILLPKVMYSRSRIDRFEAYLEEGEVHADTQGEKEKSWNLRVSANRYEFGRMIISPPYTI